MLRIIDRLILLELRGPLLFGMAMFSLLTIAAVVLQEAARFITRYQVPASYFFKLVALASPEFIVLSIPMGVLLGTLIAVGRLSSDLEITALRTCGVSLYRVAAPFLVVGVLLSGITLLGSERLVPYCKDKLSQMKSDIRAGHLGEAKQQRTIWPIREQNELRWLLTVEEIEGTFLRGVKLFYFDPQADGDPGNSYNDFFIIAAEARWEGSSWVFRDMKHVKLQAAENGEERVILEAEEALVPDFSITPESLQLREKKPEELAIPQLHALINDYIASGEYKLTSKEFLELYTILYFKYSIPFTPLFFILIAFPLAIIPQRSTRTMGMGLSLLIVLAYYVMYTVCLRLGAAGVLPPFIAAWLPNMLLVTTAIVLLQRRERR